MSIYFIQSNIHFALELVGALVFLMMAWLLIDAYLLRRENAILVRSFGMAFLAIGQILHAFNFSGDLAGFAGSGFYILGLLAVVVSFLTEARPVGVKAVIVLPAFTGYYALSSAFISVGYLLVALLAMLRYRADFNKTLRFFWLGFLMLAFGGAASFFYTDISISVPWVAGHVFELAGFLMLGWWVWQYLRLRIKESMILIFVSVVFFMAVAVTTAFSAIFIGNMESVSKTDLFTDAKVLDYAISGLKEEALAKVEFIAGQDDIGQAVINNNFPELENLAAEYLENKDLGFLTVTDADGNVILRAHALSQKEDNISGERVVIAALTGHPFVTIETSSTEKFSIRAAAPITVSETAGDKTTQKIKGAIVAGFFLDNAMVDGIKRITGLEMSIFDKDVLVATTILNSDGRTRGVGIKETDQAVKESVLAEGSGITLQSQILSRPFLASYLPLRDGDGKIVGMISSSKPQQEILELANATNRLTFVTVAILMLLLIAPMYFVIKRLIGENN
jgi:hypothetical protein